MRFLPSFCFSGSLPAHAGHVAAVALGGHVLAYGFDGFAGDDLSADGSLQGDFKQMFVDLFLQANQQISAAAFSA